MKRKNSSEIPVKEEKHSAKLKHEKMAVKEEKHSAKLKHEKMDVKEEKHSAKLKDEKMEVVSSGDSSDESLYEIRLNEFVKKEEISDFDLRALVVRCSACGRQINHHSEKDIKKHRKLSVVTCKECYEFYGSSEFSQDESGYNYCTWCGNGGKLIVCDYCPNGFCSACVRRNFGRAEISETTKEGWKCYVCNKKRLKPKMKFCDLIMSFKTRVAVKKERKTAQHPNTKNVISEAWLQAAFDESEVACKVFCKKMEKLKTIGIGKKKSLKHVVTKMEDLIRNHKASLKNVVLSVNENYLSFVERQQAKAKISIETVDITNDNSVNSFSDYVVEGKKDADKLSNNASLPASENTSKDERLQAKLKLLQSSSDSDSDKSKSTVNNDSLQNTSPKDSEKNEHQLPNNDIDIIEIEETPEKLPEKVSSVNKEKRKIDFNFSDISNSDFESFKPNVDKLMEEVESEASESLDSADDEKLKGESKVELIRCDHLLKDGETTLVISENSDMEEKLDKLVDSLCKFPRNTGSSSYRVPKAKRRSGPLKAKEPAKKALLESSSSISLSSDEDEDQKKIKLNKKVPKVSKLTRQSDHESSSSSIALDSESESDKKKKKKKTKAKKAESDSSDDFVPARKRKYDKLLHAPLLSDDEDDDSKKSKGGKREKKDKKPATRKRKVLSSDDNKKSSKSSSTSTSDDSDSKGKKTKKRRRIKKMGSSSEDNDKENDDKDTPGKGRKNIRKILSKEKVAMSTKEAQAEEKERKRRIAERQKLYNKIEEKLPEGNEIITRKMVLEVDPETKKEIVEIHPDLVCKLKPHQVDGVKFMWECTIESVKDLNKPGSGCILAHCMGLGKTLQVITFLHTCLNNEVVSKEISRAMIICPYNTALNWAMEFDYWLNDIEGDIKVHQLATVKSNLERLDILKYWFEEGGVIILSYDMFRRLAADKIPKLKKAEREKLAECLLNPGPDIVVCDEGHILKNEKSAVSVAASKLETRRRIVLTGTPLQNNLKEYHCMMSFVKPNLLGTSIEFRNRFVNPITNGQYEDSNEYDVRLMKRRIHILHKLLDGCVQRCDYSALTKFLPPKHEFVISVKLSDAQANLYDTYLKKQSGARTDVKIQGRTLFADFNNLRDIWTHPYIVHTAHVRREFRRFLKDEGDDDEEFINDGEVTESDTSRTSSSDEKSENITLDEDYDPSRNRKYKTRSRAKQDSDDDEDDQEDDEPESKQWYHEFVSEADKYNVEMSGKMALLLEILKECERIGDKVLLFSQSLLTLDMIEDILSYSASQLSQKDNADKDVLGMWVKGLDYFRMDGGTSVDFRKSYIDMFNNPSNERSRLFLISTRAGSLGTNLVGANRVIIFDTSWNPSHDVQAIFRVYRFGQIKPVYIYRLLAQGTMEEKIYDRQVTKISLSYRVVDEQQIDRHFSAADLAELYIFDRNSTKQRPTPMVPKDRLLAELLMKQKEWIVTYHEHDSLLQNETETDLTEEERQAAWAEYENEKEGNATPSFNNSNNFMDDFDASTLTNEPDFNQEYEGSKIPELKTIVEYLFDRLKKAGGPDVQKNPLEFKKRLLHSVYAIRQAFQEKHVKILRMKQEYCTRGSVPNAINKYMDELSTILKSTGDYITRLSSAITSEQTKLQQQQQQQQQQQTFQRATAFSNAYRMPMGRGNAQTYNLHTSHPISFSQMNPLQRAAFNQYMMNMKKAQAKFASTANNNTDAAKAPVITEVDDAVPNEGTSSSGPSTSTIISAPSTSTVTIKEIT